MNGLRSDTDTPPDALMQVNGDELAPAGGRRPRRLVVAMTGATGVILGIRLLEVLQAQEVETHLVVSDWAERTIRIETDYNLSDVQSLATRTYRYDNQAAPISSGSYPVDGMVIVPCSMKTLAEVAHGLGGNLITRAADVMLKEHRPLVIVPRETPLSEIHLRNMLTLSRMHGVTIVPPMPAFYNRPASIGDVVDHIVARVLDQLGIGNDLTPRWSLSPRGRAPRSQRNSESVPTA
ncbi:UbiX family flavin prenyltransferase [Microbispora sp. NBRC 16548]|uniref:UbiX family flavin prenyltransferase n=1 Tax=Microbispora sp. NBRC 16548 TaxID=3030994 RepID=UPI0024A17C7B|nr:UbiX family flavin prenyltransferase [Microbispora sp. NBRC 16548]GLX06618.1 putative UbiX-like flavin prenyltransferase [Microbispora sp. NBRC 16548]